MKPPTPLQQRRMDGLVVMLSETAAAGASCPTNSDILDRLDLSNISEAAVLLDRLHDEGLIVLERSGNRRRVTVVATGKATAWTKYGRGRPRATIGVRAEGETVLRDGFRGDLPPERYVDRSPCPYCAVRADIGCRHSRKLAA